jgi:SAM-dependent methyltransferase
VGIDNNMDENKRHKILSILSKERQFKEINQKIVFLPADGLQVHSTSPGPMGRFQELLKRHGDLYTLLVEVFSPVIASGAYNKQFRKLLDLYGEDNIILNIGSGPGQLRGRRDIINVDLFPFAGVDIVADATDLPLENESVDFMINTALLEHVGNPQVLVLEMKRVLVKGGVAFCYVPFIVPYHAAPFDFSRWTASGARELFSVIGNVQIGVGAGPTSAMLWVLQEWLALILSCGSKTLHDLILLALMPLTFPIKWVDRLLEHHPLADKIASGFFIVVRKT